MVIGHGYINPKFLWHWLQKEEHTVWVVEDVIEKIVEIKYSILEKAFSGKFGTNNPEEESTVEIIKKIMADN